ncbi:Type I-E CRISPR-associated protein Cse2/CasB [Mycobacterium canetti]|uniref:type I-E CRISPR-associated protein Cse2/CasB n=1 Tax=Mycobacterium canetti TaxID=78331 RepID=UPI002D794FE2|nr:type I-E CRISPR-associated protein Cse2/CasB [Mycobacterium canetti]WRO42894.1 Type I-E CRISPR-associated protein Cse2/CasB [Mycobacterium canetti]
MSEERQFVWVRYQNEKSDHQRQRLLIAARKAVATPPGAVPEVWPIYTSTKTADIAAEHVTAGIWGTHQQGSPHLVHQPKTAETKWPTDFGGACRLLFDEQFTGNAQVRSPIDTLADDTISKRLAVLSRTDEVDIAVSHITSLVRLMRSTGTLIGFNYNNLYWAIRTWADLEKRTATMQQWSRSYFHTQSQQAADAAGAGR